jgi:hypothetical protein
MNAKVINAVVNAKEVQQYCNEGESLRFDVISGMLALPPSASLAEMLVEGERLGIEVPPNVTPSVLARRMAAICKMEFSLKFPDDVSHRRLSLTLEGVNLWSSQGGVTVTFQGKILAYSQGEDEEIGKWE